MRTWFCIALAAGLALGVALPRPAAAQVPLTYNLTLTGDTFSGVRPTGTIDGTLGGVAVGGTYSGGAWTLTSYGRPIASGLYTCVRICRFSGTMLVGRAIGYMWTSQVPTWDAQIQRALGSIDGVFASRGDWSRAVGAWARANGLPPDLQTRLIFDARTGM
ncbi:MAG TPA: hypothetical protein VFL28_17390 [bacterium]|nr:hypothetical protein [bacterium]